MNVKKIYSFRLIANVKNGFRPDGRFVSNYARVITAFLFEI